MAVIAVDIAGTRAEAADDRAAEEGLIAVEGRAAVQVLHVAGEAGERLGDREGHARGRLSHIVQVVVGVVEAEDRAVIGARLRSDRRRDVEEAHLLHLVHRRQRHGAEFGNRKAQTKHAGSDVAAIVGLLEIRRYLEQVEARRQRPIQEIGLCEAELDLAGDLRGFQRQAQILAAAEPVGVGISKLAQKAGQRRIAQAQRQRAGRLFGDIDGQVGAVGLAARHILDLDVLEEAQCADAGA